MTTKIVCDTVADLPPQVVKELGITLIPLEVCFGTEVYREGVDITTEEFYKKLAESEVTPVTAVPAPGIFVDIYDKLAEEADEILVITVSAKLSGIHDVALRSRELMKKKCRVEVLDSQWAIMAQGFIVMAAARAAQAGASFNEVLEAARSTISRVQLCSSFDTLEYLKRGGRIGKAEAFMGSLLHINPITGMKDGLVMPLGRERSRAKAMDFLYNFAMQYSHIEEMAIAYVTAVDDAERLLDRLNAKFPKERVYRSSTSPVIGVHTGPSLIALALLGDR